MKIKIETAPFNPSRTRVAAASFLSPVLKTFVAPILPGPMARISPYPAAFVRIRPKGMEPSR